MTNEITIYPQQAALYIDVYCWKCKKLAAMSNTVEYEGRHYCNRCFEKMFTTHRIFELISEKRKD